MRTNTQKKKHYLILGKESGFLYGAFPRTKNGKIAAKSYRAKLKDRKDKEFFIK